MEAEVKALARARSARRRLRACGALAAAISAFALPLPGQRTWIVDSANGPGTHFSDIDDAYAASGVGDTIIVRPGNGQPYDLPPSITRAIRIVAPGAAPVPVRQRSGIVDIPQQHVVVLDNLDFATESFNAGVPIRRARGLVILSRMYASPHVYAAAGWAEDSERVVFVRFRNHLSAGPGIITRSSNVWLIDSFVKSDYSAGQPLTLYHGGAHFAGGTAWVIGSRVEGGTAHPNGLSGVDWGIESGGSNLFVAGGSTVIGGSWGYATGLCTRNANSLRHWSVYQRSYLPPDPRAVWFVHDPNTTLDNCVESQGHEMTREFPAVLPGQAMRGQPQSIRTFGPTRSIVSVFASFVHGAPPVRLSIGDVWLDPGLVVHVGTGAVDANRRLTMQTTIPSWLAVGDVLVYQAVSLSPRSAWEISQPGFAVVRDP